MKSTKTISKAKTKAKKTTPEKTPKAPGSITEMDLSAFAHQEMRRYGEAVNEDRAVPEYHDGFKPVQRRVLWAAYEGGYRNSKAVEKSARLVGDALGKFHPHGDQACYGAVVNMVNMVYPLLDGEGNFGDFFKPDSYAAMRYTNVRLSKFSERVFFDPFYMPVMKRVANYDGKQQEPLYCVSLLPNVLFNTTFSIGVGLTTRYPRFTLHSVADVLERAFAGEEVTVDLCTKLLKFTSQYGGVAAPSQSGAIKELFSTGKGRIVYESPYELDTKARKMVFTGFAPFSNFDMRAAKLLSLPGVVNVVNESGTKDRIGRFAVYFKSNTDGKNIPQLAKSVAAVFREKEDYVNNITIRAPDKENPEEPKVSLRSTTIPKLIAQWVAYRIKLEVAACTYQIEQKDKEIRRLEVLRIAVANRAMIIKALDKPLDDDALAAYLAKALKLTIEEGRSILELKVRQLKALEDKKLVAELKQLKATRASYESRRKKPAEYCKSHVQELVKDFK